LDRLHQKKVLTELRSSPLVDPIHVYVYGVTGDTERVKISGLSAAVGNSFQPSSTDVSGALPLNSRVFQQKKRVAVLISGSGMLMLL